MITTEQHPFVGKSRARRCGSNELGELIRRLTGVAAELIYLTRSRLDQQCGAILNRLLDGCIDDTGMSGTDSVDAYFLRVTVAANNILQPLARIVVLRFHRLAGLFGPRLEQQMLVERGGNAGLGAMHASEIFAVHVIDDVIRAIL